jgi:hypothetical protein
VVVARLASKDEEGKIWWALSMLVFEVAIVLLHSSIYFLARVGKGGGGRTRQLVQISFAI